MIELGKAGSHLSTSRSRCGDDNQRSACLNIFVPSVSFVTYDQRDVGRITFYYIMDINFNAKLFQTSFEKIGTVLARVLCDNNTSDKEAIGFKFIFQTENVSVISDPEVTADFVGLNIGCTDNNHNLCGIR